MPAMSFLTTVTDTSAKKEGRQAPPPTSTQGPPESLAVVISVVVAIEVEHVHQVADRGSVAWHVWIFPADDWVGQVVPAPPGYGAQPPVGLDELVERHVIGVRVHDTDVTREARDHDHGDAGAVAEEVDRLDIARVIVAAALVRGNHDRRILPQRRIRLDPIDDLLDEAFEELPFRGSRMPVEEPVGLHDGDGRQRAALDVAVEIADALEVGAQGGVGHDLRRVEERIADVAVGRLLARLRAAIPSLAVVVPRDAIAREQKPEVRL